MRHDVLGGAVDIVAPGPVSGQHGEFLPLGDVPVIILLCCCCKGGIKISIMLVMLFIALFDKRSPGLTNAALDRKVRYDNHNI